MKSNIPRNYRYVAAWLGRFSNGHAYIVSSHHTYSNDTRLKFSFLSRKRNNETVRIDSVIKGRANGEVKILIIDGASRDHQGHYECIAKNPYGQVSSEAELTLQSRFQSPSVGTR